MQWNEIKWIIQRRFALSLSLQFPLLRYSNQFPFRLRPNHLHHRLLWCAFGSSFFLLVQPPSTNLVPSQANLQLGIFTPTLFIPSHPPIKQTNRDRWFAISQSCFRCYRPRVASLCVGEGDFPITSRGKKEGFSVYLIIIKGYQSPHSTVFGPFSRVYSSSFELCSAGWVPLEGVKLIQMQIINGLHTK